METDPTANDPMPYKRCRFTTTIPRDRFYTSDHYWLKEESPNLWRVGLTPWAVRMLGDFVEFTIEVAEGSSVQLHQPLGTLEAFKAVSEILSVATGTLIAVNPILANNLDAISQDPYDGGWLYLIQGTRRPDLYDAARYAGLLDETIDILRGMRTDNEM
jgi:glycine cleavage system H protein